LAAGTYFVQESTPADYVQTGPAVPGYYTVQMISGTGAFGRDFDNFQFISLSGLAFNDNTGNGLTPDDTPAGGVTVTLFRDANNNGVLDPGDTQVAQATTATSGSVGTYSFANVGPGTYFVQETLPAGFVLTTPGAPGYYTFRPTSGNSLSAINFANFKAITISGRVFSDAGATGTELASDPGLDGIPVALYRDVLGNGQLNPLIDPVVAVTTSATVSGQDGEYAFTGVGPGQFIVHVPQQAGRTVTFPPPGSYSSTVQAGVNQPGNDFGILFGVNQGFVYRIFVDLLGRAPASGEMTNWTTILNAGLSRTTVLQLLESGPEYQARLIQNMFLSYLGRTATPAEVINLSRVLNNTAIYVGSGGAVQTVRALILSSPEYFQHAGATATSFLSALFRDALGRTITTPELAGLTSVLNSGFSPALLVRAVLNSMEGEEYLVGTFYARFLHRPAGANEAFVFAGAVQQGLTEQTLIAILMGSDEYLNSF
jgi:hypothetical protein